MLDQHAFQLEGADPVVRRLEHVVGAADIGEVTLCIARGDVAGAIDRARERRDRAVILLVTLHQRRGTVREVDADLAFLGILVVGIEQPDLVAGQGAAHRAGLDRLAGRIADLGRGFGLAVEVADGEAPGLLDLLDHFGVQRLAGRQHLAQRRLAGFQVFLDQHAPHGRRRAERRDLVGDDRIEEIARVEARLVGDEDRGAGDPRREEAAPRVLGPARRGDVEMHVAGAQSQHEDRGEMADRITAMGMQHELGLGRRARREIEQHRIVGLRRPVRREFGRVIQQLGIRMPAGRGVSDGDACQALVEALELRRFTGGGHHMARPSTLEAVGEIDRREQGGRGNDDGAQLHGGQHHFPERRHVAQHQQHAVAALDAQRAQSVGDPIGAL